MAHAPKDMPSGPDAASPAIDVVIPILNEADRIEPLVQRLWELGFRSVIVVDGGSTDRGPAIAEVAGATVIHAARGRGVQMNAGAAAGRAPALLFLHADTSLPEDACEIVTRTLSTPTCVAGCFRLRFDSRDPRLRLLAWFSRFDTVVSTFGDQAFFIRRAAFAAAGGFPEWPFLEDVELRRRMRRLGRFRKASAAVMTSARRFEAEGVLRRHSLNTLILTLHLLGVPASRLARWYR